MIGTKTVKWKTLPQWLSGKESACSAGDVGDVGSISWLGRTLEEGMATYSRILAWEVPWTEELDGLQSMSSQSTGHCVWSQSTHTHTHTHTRRNEPSPLLRQGGRHESPEFENSCLGSARGRKGRNQIKTLSLLSFVTGHLKPGRLGTYL